MITPEQIAVIESAASMLAGQAWSLRRRRTIGGVCDWTGEDDAKHEHDNLVATSIKLNAIAEALLAKQQNRIDPQPHHQPETPMNAPATATFATPELNEGEIYAGAIITPTGEGHHIILLPGDHEEANWADSLEWAKSIGGDLPDRVEQALFFKHLPEQFQKDWYWSNTQHVSDSDYAWFQNFDNGFQYYNDTVIKLRARAVRRLAI